MDEKMKSLLIGAASGAALGATIGPGGDDSVRGFAQ
jgi:hypothetical protein